jgi:two-component system, OmpR family, alkaline phosphatase synthesis response regulator PhoP
MPRLNINLILHVVTMSSLHVSLCRKQKPSHMQSTARILVVDDEEDILTLLKYNLEKSGYDVSTAIDGQQAIALTHSFRPNLILLDVMMPGMDGIEVCQYIRAQPEFADVLIVFLTARNEAYTQITALDSGGDDFINKPIKPNVLNARIQAMLRRIQTTKPIISQSQLFGDLVIDVDNFKVTVMGKDVGLVKKEFELLQLLASKPGKVFKRPEILSRVWGDDVIVGDRTIDVYIRKLREKLGEKYIQTVKGVGYRFEF